MKTNSQQLMPVWLVVYHGTAQLYRLTFLHEFCLCRHALTLTLTFGVRVFRHFVKPRCWRKRMLVLGLPTQNWFIWSWQRDMRPIYKELKWTENKGLYVKGDLRKLRSRLFLSTRLSLIAHVVHFTNTEV